MKKIYKLLLAPLRWTS